MRILNFGSLNIDYVYRVDQFVQPGETKSSLGLMVNSGGKGLNQSIAAAKAGSSVLHAGIVGRDGGFLIDKLAEHGVDTSLIERSEQVNGHAIIQVDQNGQNCILLYGGTNQQLSKAYIDETLKAFGSEGLVLLQNETNLVEYIIAKAQEQGLTVALNAAPISSKVFSYPLELLDWLVVNEIEGAAIAGTGNNEDILQILAQKYPNCSVLMTLGKNGARCLSGGKVTSVGSYTVEAIDTTAAGDTFTGYFLTGVLAGKSIAEALLWATTASALCVQRPGAADSIPEKSEVERALAEGSLGKLEAEQ